jgi:hypothetical protein
MHRPTGQPPVAGRKIRAAVEPVTGTLRLSRLNITRVYME